jgi:diaminopimelate epimerase
MPNIPFWKLQSVGNDFPLVHLSHICSVVGDAEPAVTEHLGKLAIAMADRQFGVGGDGLLAVGLNEGRVHLRMFNPDGTEDFCGNGIRCAAWHAHRVGWVGESFSVVHGGRDVPTHVQDRFVSSILGQATYDPQLVPHRQLGEIFNATVWSGMDAGVPLSLFGSVLSTGSTHTILPTDHLPDPETFTSVSQKIETDPLFPDRTSVIWVEEIAPFKLRILIWERGVGETFGCGTGASAAAADYLRRKDTGGEVMLASKGGALQVKMANWQSPIEITGVAESVFSGEFRY